MTIVNDVSMCLFECFWYQFMLDFYPGCLVKGPYKRLCFVVVVEY